MTATSWPSTRRGQSGLAKQARHRATGPGVGEGAVVAVDGYLIALNSSDGAELHLYLGRILAALLVVDEYVVVQTVDNRMVRCRFSTAPSDGPSRRRPRH